MLSGFIALAIGSIIVVRGPDRCGVVPDPRGMGDISRHLCLLSLSYDCKDLLSDMMTVKPEFIHRWPRDSSVISFLH